jgi:hypothetical protein
VIVAVTVVRVVQMPGDEVAHMVAVRDCFVATLGAVNVALGVPRAAMRRRAGGRMDASTAMRHSSTCPS